MKVWFIVALALLSIISRPTHAQQQLFKLLASDGGAGDWFGASVDIDGDLAVVGAYDHDHLGPGSNTGGAYVYRVSTGQQLFELVSTDLAPVDLFGRSVGISGWRIVVGAYNAAGGSGSAYVFDVNSGQQVARLVPSDGAPGGGFGLAVAIEGNIAAVGTHAAGVYVFNVTTGQQLHKLVTGVGAFGGNDSLAMDGGRLIGKSGGTAYVFDAASGQQIATLVPSGASSHLVGIKADRAIVSGGGQTTAYVFSVSTGQELFTITSPGPSWVDLSATRVFIGAQSQGNGAVYVFDVATGQPITTLAPTDATSSFGFWGAVDGDKAIFGAIGDTTLGSPPAGAAYLFDVDKPDPFVSYGSGCGGTGGVVPTLAMTGGANPGGQVQVAITNCVGSGSAFLVLGTQQAALAMRYGCTLNAHPLLPAIIGPLPLFPIGAQGPGAGSISFPVNVPTNIAVPVSVTLQAFVVDSGSPAGYSNTNGVELNIE